MFKWVTIFNVNDFEATGLVSRTYTLDIVGVGQKEILVTKGNLISMTVDGVMLPVNFEGKNPFTFDGFSAYIYDTGEVVLGVPVAS